MRIQKKNRVAEKKGEIVQDRRWVFARIIRKDAPALFGRLFRMYLERADLTQTELEEKSIALRDGWAGEGFFSKSESGDLTQSSISKVLNGQYKRPTYGQIFIWLYVIEEALKAKGETFPKDVRDNMFHLMRYVPPEGIVNAYECMESLAPESVPRKEK